MDAFRMKVCAAHPMAPTEFLDELLQEAISTKNWDAVRLIGRNPRSSESAREIAKTYEKKGA